MKDTPTHANERINICHLSPSLHTPVSCHSGVTCHIGVICKPINATSSGWLGLFTRIFVSGRDRTNFVPELDLKTVELQNTEIKYIKFELDLSNSISYLNICSLGKNKLVRLM